MERWPSGSFSGYVGLQHGGAADTSRQSCGADFTKRGWFQSSLLMPFGAELWQLWPASLGFWGSNWKQGWVKSFGDPKWNGVKLQSAQRFCWYIMGLRPIWHLHQRVLFLSELQMLKLLLTLSWNPKYLIIEQNLNVSGFKHHVECWFSLCFFMVHPFFASANRPSFAAKDSHGARGAVAPAPFDR